MTDRDHLARAKDFIARGEDFYRKAADEIKAAMAADPTLGFPRVAQTIGKSPQWCRDIVQWSTNSQGPPTPYGGEEQNEARYERHDKTVLRDPERLDRVVADLDTDALTNVYSQVTRELGGRNVAKIAEHHDEERTVAGLMGGREEAEKLQRDFQPSNLWIDTLVIRVDKNTRELEALIAHNGLRLAPIDHADEDAESPEAWAFARVDAAERRLAEVRAALQERLHDQQVTGREIV